MKKILIFILLFFSCLSIYGQDTLILSRLNFDFNLIEIKKDNDYNNFIKYTLPYIHSNENNIQKIILTGYASPEGNEQHNRELADGRIESVSEITFSTGLYTEGDITINTKGNPSITDMNVINKDNQQSYNFAADNTDLTNDYEVLSTAMVIPQGVPAQVTIKFDITLTGDGGHIEYRNRTVTRTIWTGNDDNNNPYVANFAAGHKYIYRYYVTADDVNFTITVDD